MVIFPNTKWSKGFVCFGPRRAERHTVTERKTGSINRDHQSVQSSVKRYVTNLRLVQNVLAIGKGFKTGYGRDGRCFNSGFRIKTLRTRIFFASTAFLTVFALSAISAVSSASEVLKLLAFGDSLTAGYGLAQDEGFTSQLEAALRKEGYEVQVINAGVSGDTSAGGAARIDWALTDEPGVIIVELGANDGLRGVEPSSTRENLTTILDKSLASGATVILAGMLAPPNLGREFGEEFNAIFPELAAERPEVLFYPFFLDGVAADPALNLADGIHPNAKGIAIIVERMLPVVQEAMKRSISR